MKTLYVLAAVCMSLHAFTASAETPALMADDYSSYFSSIDDLDAREELAARDTTPDADVATDPATDNSFAINPDADDYTAAEVIPGTGEGRSWTCTTTRGYLVEKRSMNCGSTVALIEFGDPILNSPVAGSARDSTSLTLCLSSSNTAMLRLSIACA